MVIEVSPKQIIKFLPVLFTLLVLSPFIVVYLIGRTTTGKATQE